MNLAKLTKPLLFAALIGGSQAALACGEMMVNAGKGLAFQSWLAQVPANVLVLYTEGSDERTYAGLEQAGHHLTLVTDATQLAEELATGSYDIVIAEYDMADTVAPITAGRQATRFLPIVQKSMRKSEAVRDRFEQFLIEGTGVSRYLSVIDRVLSR
jgi:hypothetical protein